MRLPALALLTLLPATMVTAETGQWSLQAGSTECAIAFVAEEVDDGIFFVDRGEADCGTELNRITGYALHEEGAVVALYSTLDGVDHLGQVSRQEGGDFAGRLRSGTALQLHHVAGPRGIPDPVSGEMTGEAAVADVHMPEDDEAAADAAFADGPTGPCLRYPGNGDCAAAEDLGPPDGGELQVLTRLNLRDQGTTQDSTVIGKVEAGTCAPVTFCAEDEQGRLWCGVQTPAGIGYVLKQDDATVYARNSCR